MIVANFLILVVVITLCKAVPQSNNLAMQHALSAVNSNQRPGQLNFPDSGTVSGNNGRNWNGNVNAGVGSTVWQSQNGRHSIGTGLNVGQSGGRSQGQSWKSKPDVGVGAAYRYKFRK